MSYEYRLLFADASSAQQVTDVLKASAACVTAQGREVCLKDWGLKTFADYDIKLTKEDEKTLWLEVNFRSRDLYRLLQEALNDRLVKCFEDDDLDDGVTLKEALRIKGGN
jgi:ribosomal protein S6